MQKEAAKAGLDTDQDVQGPRSQLVTGTQLLEGGHAFDTPRKIGTQAKTGQHALRLQAA